LIKVRNCNAKVFLAYLNLIFFDKIKEDNVVKDYTTHTTSIYTYFIDTTNNNPSLKFGQLGIFPLIACIEEGKFNLIHYLTPGSTNLITNKISNFKATMGLCNLG